MVYVVRPPNFEGPYVAARIQRDGDQFSATVLTPGNAPSVQSAVPEALAAAATVADQRNLPFFVQFDPGAGWDWAWGGLEDPAGPL